MSMITPLPPITELRRCKVCDNEKAPEEFPLKGKYRLRTCRECHNKIVVPKVVAWQKANTEKRKAALVAYYQAHKEEHRERVRRWTERNPDARRNIGFRAVLRRFGMTAADYEKMLVAQNGVCAICRNPELEMYRGRPGRLVIDHDHNTGEVRGLLCQGCNRGLGQYQDDPLRLRAAADYIERRRP